MLTKARKETIPAALTVTGQGESFELKLVYRNMRQSELETAIREQEGNMKSVVLRMVESWESEYELSEAGLAEAEDDRPGITIAIIQGFHAARRVAKEKN